MKTIKASLSTGITEVLEVVEDLGYQIGIDEYVVRVKLSNGKQVVFRSPSKRGLYRRHEVIILPKKAK